MKAFITFVLLCSMGPLLRAEESLQAKWRNNGLASPSGRFLVSSEPGEKDALGLVSWYTLVAYRGEGDVAVESDRRDVALYTLALGWMDKDDVLILQARNGTISAFRMNDEGKFIAVEPVTEAIRRQAEELRVARVGE